jgi:hypothetical protein
MLSSLSRRSRFPPALRGHTVHGVPWSVIPPEVVPDARMSLPDLNRGERLLDAFDWNRRLVPSPQISLERAILLVLEFAEGRSLSVGRCKTCPNVLLLEQEGEIHDRCPACRLDQSTPMSSEFSCKARASAEGIAAYAMVFGVVATNLTPTAHQSRPFPDSDLGTPAVLWRWHAAGGWLRLGRTLTQGGLPHAARD